MLKKSASGVIAALKGSTYREQSHSDVEITGGGFSVRQDSFKGRTAHTNCGMYLLASSLDAALPAERRVLARRDWAGEESGLFEHPAGDLPCPIVQAIEVVLCRNDFQAAC